MTGGEIAAAAAAGKVIASAGKNLFTEPGENEQLRELAKNSPAMQAAAESYARRVAVKQQLLLTAYKPLAKLMGISRDYFANQFPAELAAKVADIPDEAVTEPKPSVAVPAMQGLAISLDEPDLKEMYLNLLATATDNRQSGDAHPSFAEIIKQLSGEEARLLSPLIASRQVAIVRFKVITKYGGYVILKNHVFNTVDAAGAPAENPSIPVYLDNWARLGLVTVTYTEHFTDDDLYEWVDRRPELASLRATRGDNDNQVEWDKGVVILTAFGLRFGAATGARKGSGNDYVHP